MKVKELIQRLEHFDPKLNVVIPVSVFKDGKVKRIEAEVMAVYSINLTKLWIEVSD